MSTESNEPFPPAPLSAPKIGSTPTGPHRAQNRHSTPVHLGRGKATRATRSHKFCISKYLRGYERHLRANRSVADKPCLHRGA